MFDSTAAVFVAIVVIPTAVAMIAIVATAIATAATVATAVSAAISVAIAVALIATIRGIATDRVILLRFCIESQT